MKYKVLLCLLWELTTPVPVERRLADDLCFALILISDITAAQTYRLLTVELL